ESAHTACSRASPTRSDPSTTTRRNLDDHHHFEVRPLRRARHAGAHQRRDRPRRPRTAAHVEHHHAPNPHRGPRRRRRGGDRRGGARRMLPHVPTPLDGAARAHRAAARGAHAHGARVPPPARTPQPDARPPARHFGERRRARGQAEAADAMSITGSALFAKIASLTGDAREAEIIAAAVAGNFPSWLLDWVPITMQQLGGPDGSIVLHEVTIPVARNGLRIGNNTDQRKTPCNFKSAKTIAKAHGWTFPTPRIVDAIYRAADKQMFMPVPGNFPHAMNLPLAAAGRREATETYEEMHNAC